GTGMIRLPCTRNLEATDTNDAGHDTDLFAFALKTWTLLNMTFQISHVPTGIQRDSRPADVARLEQGRAKGFAELVGRCPKIGFSQMSAKGTPPRQRPIGPFFVGKGNNVDSEIGLSAGLKACPGDLQAVEYSHSTVQPSPFGDRISMRSDEDGFGNSFG